MQFNLKFTPLSEGQYEAIQSDPSKKAVVKAVRKALGYLETNPGHNSLNSHHNKDYPGPPGATVWQSYAQNKTPQAYRIFWHYGPGKRIITILGIEPHPKD